MLWSYAAELRKHCAGNTVKINTEIPHPTLPPRFGSFYFCLDGCKKGFSKGCIPFIGADGCHLKTQYGGQFVVDLGKKTCTCCIWDLVGIPCRHVVYALQY